MRWPVHDDLVSIAISATVYEACAGGVGYILSMEIASDLAGLTTAFLDSSAFSTGRAS